MKKWLIIFGAFGILLLSGCSVRQTEVLSSIKAVPSSFDFGDIDKTKGKVSTTVEILNTGSETIKLYRLATSCGCTVADMDMSDLPPGASRQMTITFDPMTHPDEVGPIIRVVYLQTSDTNLPELEIEITGNVVDMALGTGTVFFNEACRDCGELVKEFYPSFFEEYGYTLILKDYINERANRKELTKFNEEWGVPFELQSHIETFVGRNLMIGGHVPEKIMRYLLENPSEYEKLVVYQDDMHGSETDYKVWDFKGEIKTYPIDEPITTYLAWLKGNKTDLPTADEKKTFLGLFGLITGSAFLDGLNPCAFAVLLFFIAFLFSIKRTRAGIWKMGLTYVFGIYLAYLLIGLGIAQAIVISGSPHLMAYIGAYLVIGLGAIQLLGIIFPAFPIKLRIPVNTKATVEKWIFKATTPAAFIGGFIVGLCTFPCSGGIYVAIISMLSASQTYGQGIAWMVWYNVIFVTPLLIMLALAGNPKTTERLQKWERGEAVTEKIIVGISMIAVGVIILLFFVK